MSRSLVIKGVMFNVPTLVHRKIAYDGWSVALPGFERHFTDAAYGGTHQALLAAIAARSEVFDVKVEQLLEYCTLDIHIAGFRHGNMLAISASHGGVFHYFTQPHDKDLAGVLGGSNKVIRLTDPIALQLLGRKEYDRVMQMWQTALDNHIKPHKPSSAGSFMETAEDLFSGAWNHGHCYS